MNKNKKILILLFTFSLLIVLQTSIGLSAFAADKPSDWAEPEVKSAVDNMLVPQSLQSNYQSNIKRYEYVLLALKVYDLAGKNAEIKDSAPFGDVKNHSYELDIVRAYNAGIIKGDGKGSFFPDKNITREEIASLVVNLLKQISPDRDYELKSTYPYADRNMIADWATYYIDYCYENKILNGTGNNKMDPKGNATIEQSIALLYRLANSEQLLQKSAYGTLQIYDETAGSIAADPRTIENFVKNYSADTFNALKQLSENENIAIISLGDTSTSLSINNNSIMLNDEDNQTDLAVLVHNTNDELLISSYRQLLVTFKISEKGIVLFDEYVLKMKANEWIDDYTSISETTAFLVQTLRDVSGKNSYKVTFIQN